MKKMKIIYRAGVKLDYLCDSSGQWWHLDSSGKMSRLKGNSKNRNLQNAMKSVFQVL